MNGIIGKKLGMTSLYNADGKRVACTVIEAGPCVVTQVKSESKDGYKAVQIAFGDKKEKHTNSAEKGHFAKANTTGKREVIEFRDADNANIGDVIDVTMFEAGEFVDVVGTSTRSAQSFACSWINRCLFFPSACFQRHSHGR